MNKRSTFKTMLIQKGAGLLCGLVVAFSYPSALYAQDENAADTRDKLDKINSEIERRKNKKKALEEQAKLVAKEAKSYAVQMVDVNRDIRLTDDTIMRLDRRIVALEATANAKRQDLLSRKDDMVELIAAIQRMSKRPPALSLLQPQEALTTARSAALLSNILPYISENAKRLRSDISGLNTLYGELSERRLSLKDTLQKLAGQTANLKSLIAARERQEVKSRDAARRESKRLTRLLTRSKSTKDLLEKLEQELHRSAARSAVKQKERYESKPSGISTSFRNSKGQLPFPVIGQIVTKFGESTGPGHTKGIEIIGRSSSQVVAPFDGQIVFAGPFRDYGQIVIIAHGEGYHSLVAGIGNLYSVHGQWVLQGEPIGGMNQTGSNNSNLYVEIRKSGQSINPEPWFKK